MKRVLIPGVILCGADVAQAVDDKNMYMHFFEEMTVYAPVPVPVNGNTHYTSEPRKFFGAGKHIRWY